MLDHEAKFNTLKITSNCSPIIILSIKITDHAVLHSVTQIHLQISLSEVVLRQAQYQPACLLAPLTSNDCFFRTAEEVKLSAEEEEEEAGVQRTTQAAESAVWRLTDGQGDPADRITASRSAKGRLDFVLQVKIAYLYHDTDLHLFPGGVRAKVASLQDPFHDLSSRTTTTQKSSTFNSTRTKSLDSGLVAVEIKQDEQDLDPDLCLCSLAMWRIHGSAL